MPLPIFPVHIFNPQEVSARVIGSVISGGTALSGEEDIIATDGGGRWEIGYSGITLRTPTQIKAWEAWEGFLGRGTTDCLVPFLSLGHANRSSNGRGLMPVSKLVTDDPVFPTAMSYSAPPIGAHAAASAGLRATTLSIAIDKGSPLVGGEKFGVNGRAYRVIRQTSVGQFQTEPPLREAIESGTALHFDLPLLKCRSAPGESWSPTLSFGRRGEVSIRFLENAA